MDVFIRNIAASLIVAASLSTMAAAQTGPRNTRTIRGRVLDSLTLEPVAGTMVTILSLNEGTISDADGTFSLAIHNLVSGMMEVSFQMLGYTDRNIKVVPATDSLRILLAPYAESIGNSTVIAKKRTNSDLSISREIRESKMVVSGISSASISRTQDRDAGEVVKRMAGISITDDRYLVARGLSQRYNNVWINGASVPSSEADSRSFSFDMIPASQIENILIIKSPIPDVPSDFTGGFVKIATKDTPEAHPFSVTYNVGVNASTIGRGFRYHPGGSFTRLLGFDGNAYNDNWDIDSRMSLPDQKFSFAYGSSSKVGSKMFVVDGSVNYSYASRTLANMENSRFGIYNKSEDKPEYLYKYTDNQYKTTVKIGEMLDFALLGENDKYYFRNIFNQIGQDVLTERTGWQNVSSYYGQEKTDYDYLTRSTYSGQIAGLHNIGKESSGLLSWQAGYSYAGKSQPDRRMVNRQENDLVGDSHYGEMCIDQNSIERDSISLSENMLSASVSYEGKMLPGLVIKSGLYSDYRTRNYRTRELFYRYNQANLPVDFPYGDVVDEIMKQSNYGSDKLYIYDDTDNRDSYKGNSLYAAAYVAVDYSAGPWDIYSGLRFEHDGMNLISYTRIKEWVTKTRSYVYDNVFPSINISYKMGPRSVWRLAYGMSTNRPEFREMSSSVYYDFDLFSDVKGNPDLRSAFMHNLDFRYECYPNNEESISVALFYKHFKNPIETTFLDAGGSYTYTFENAEQAYAFGVEADVKKDFSFIGMPELSIVFNGSLIGSEVEFSDLDLEHDRPLQGQSPYLVNTTLSYQPGRWSFAVMYNRIGKRIVGIGKVDTSVGGSIDNDIPDMYEMPRNALDLVAGYAFGGGWSLKVNVKDVLNEKVSFCQFPKYTASDGTLVERQQVTKCFRPGTEAFAILNWSF